MKCPKCGSSLMIDDAKCSFCGEDNPFAVKHREDMSRLEGDYKKTKSEVLRKTTRLNKWSVKIVWIALLVTINLLLLFFSTNAYDVKHYLREKRADANYDTHVEALDRYEKERNYVALSQYYSVNGIGSSDKFTEYEKVYMVCDHYGIVYKYLMDLVTWDIEEDNYFSKEDRIEAMVESIDYMYKWSTQNEYDNPEMYAPKHMECMQDAITQIENMVKVYCNLTTEEMDEFREMSNAKRQVLIEEGLGRNE